jgi:aquaporin Z
VGSVDYRKAVAELVGSFVFFLIGYLGVTATRAMMGPGVVPDLVVIAFAFGLGLFVAIAIGGAVSGGHFNPAVTVAALVDGRIDVVNAVGYVIAQVAGALAATLMVGAIFDADTVKGFITSPGGGVTDIEALVIETAFTAIFLAVILTATRRVAAQAAFVIPLALIAIHLAIVPFTGSSVNPARSIGPALIGGDWTTLWIYIVGPIVGGLVGWAVYRYLTPSETPAG